MEDNNSAKLSSRSGKISKVVSSGMSDVKQKKSKKKKKGRRNSNKPDIEEINKTSDEERGSLEVQGVGAAEDDSEGVSGQARQGSGSSSTTKLPIISKVKADGSTTATPPSSSPPLPSNNKSQVQPASHLFRPEQSVVNSLAHKINILTIKQRPLGKGGNSRGSRQIAGGRPAKLMRGAKEKGQLGVKSAPAGVKAGQSSNGFGASSPTSNSKNYSGLVFSASSAESLRWENVLEDSEEERERMRLYKINRRKRYLAAAQAKGLGWALNQSFQIADDYGVESRKWATTTTVGGSTSGMYQATDYSPMRSLRASGSHGMMGAAMVEC